MYYLPPDAPIKDDISSCFPKFTSDLFRQTSIYAVFTEFQPLVGHYPYAYDEGNYEIFAGPEYQMMRN